MWRKCAKRKAIGYTTLHVRFHCAWYNVWTNITPWNMCRLRSVLCVVLEFLAFLAYHKSLFLFMHCNSLHSVPALLANKVIDVEIYCQQIAVERLIAYWAQYQMFNKFVCKCFITPFLTFRMNEVAVVATL